MNNGIDIHKINFIDYLTLLQIIQQKNDNAAQNR